MKFLTVEDALAIHASQLDRFGGGSGVRSPDLLESAVAQAQASFGGEYLHSDVFEMAAAYLYHIVQNHPFVDGNKRTGLLCALVFLDLNGRTIGVPDERLYEMTMARSERRGREGAGGRPPACAYGPAVSTDRRSLELVVPPSMHSSGPGALGVRRLLPRHQILELFDRPLVGVNPESSIIIQYAQPHR